VLWLVVTDPAVRFQLEAGKGMLFVVTSALLVYWLTARARRDHERIQTRLRRQTRELSIFHRIVRHNLRNVATVISGRTEAARESADADPHLDVIERKADRLATLADKASLLRGVSSEEGGKHVKQDLTKAVADICRQRREAFPDATIEMEAPDCVETMAPARLGFAISELVENAIHHAGPEATVQVTVTADEATIRITVADDGPGLPDVERTAIEGNVEAILEHSEGVGLWLVRLIVENAGGTVALEESQLGGAAVTMTLPKIEEPS
jgi:signal transduction histidine kinase